MFEVAVRNPHARAHTHTHIQKSSLCDGGNEAYLNVLCVKTEDVHHGLRVLGNLLLRDAGDLEKRTPLGRQALHASARLAVPQHSRVRHG